MTFDERIDESIEEMQRECNYVPRAFVRMRRQYGTVEAVKKLIVREDLSKGLIKLNELGRLDLSMESIVNEKAWRNLFSESEIHKANEKLAAIANRKNRAWTMEELTVATTAYIEMLAKERDGIEYKKREYNRLLAEGKLSGRTHASIEFRMQNISAVLDGLGLEYIKGYLPKGNVGRNVAQKILEALEKQDSIGACREQVDGTQKIQKFVKRVTINKPKGNEKPRKLESKSYLYERNPLVKAFVLQRANGRCEACGVETFLTDSNEQYLEIHHLTPLSEGGSDTTANAIALCPLCHRKLHYGKDRKTYEKKLVGRFE